MCSIQSTVMDVHKRKGSLLTFQIRSISEMADVARVRMLFRDSGLLRVFLPVC